ncbi:MAG: VCBS repeat-containing protein [Ignavibacteriae bacterium]|nr:VCBS repeat-containing protein [Ignavibacteriota bacterium]
MIEHISEQTLEKIFLTPEEITEQEKSAIEAHIEECAYCREHHLKLKEFYTSLQENLESPPIERDRAFAERLLARKRLLLPTSALAKKAEEAIDAYAEIIEPYYRPLAQRIIRYIQIHPIRVASATSFAGAAIVLALLTFKPVKDTNPAYARAKDEFLVVYNAQGDELWRKHIGIEYDQYVLRNPAMGEPHEQSDYLATTDVDGDGTREVLGIFGYRTQWSLKNAVICYNADSSVKWIYPIHRDMTFGIERYSDQYHTRQLFVEDFNNDGRDEIIVSANHTVYYPSVILALNGSDRKLIGEYWWAGVPRYMALHDLDGDGSKELFVPGENNSYNQACLAILDPRELRGHSPATIPYTPVGVPEGNERAYILFPQSDIQSMGKRKRNIASHCKLSSDSLLMVGVSEYWTEKEHVPLLYYFNSRLECTRVDASDPFLMLHRRLEAEGKLTRKVDTRYLEELRRSVLYWDGEKFVNTPTMNKKYAKLFLSPYTP